jgi:hypothetical protein
LAKVSEVQGLGDARQVAGGGAAVRIQVLGPLRVWRGGDEVDPWPGMLAKPSILRRDRYRTAGDC